MTIRRNKMKKLLHTILILLAVVLTFASCGITKCLNHSYNDEYLFDETHHWLSCNDCGATKDYAEHASDDSGCCLVCKKNLQNSNNNQDDNNVINGVIYAISEDNIYAEVVGYDGTQAEVIIEEKYKGLPVNKISQYAFYGKDVITSITIPVSVSTIEYIALSGCENLLNISVDANNPNYESIDGNLYSKDKKTLIQYAIGKTDTRFVIPETVTCIGDYAFYNCNNLIDVTIADTVVSIGKYAFSFCSNLENVIIGNSVENIGDSAFVQCPKLTNIAINNSVRTIGEFAFQNCDNLVDVIIPNSVISIGNSAFSYNERLTNVTIGNSVANIGRFTFSACPNLISIEVDEDNESYKSIDATLYSKDGETLVQYAIGKTNSSFIISDSVKYVESYAFYGCSYLKNVLVGSSVVSIGDLAFCDCTALTDVIIGSAVNYIGQQAFGNCDNLTSVTFENTEGWWYSMVKSAVSGTEISASSLAKASVSAWYLKSSYCYYYWHRN